MDSADRVNEKCAVVGVFNAKNSALLCYYSLFAMQHRGQESSGISTTNGHKITTLKGEGLVTAVFGEGLDRLVGSASIGHNRYSTAGDDSKCDTQPIFAKYSLGEIALAHNGNLVNAKEVRDELIAQGAIFQSHLDTENLIHLIARSKKARLRDRIIEGLQKIKGAYSFVILSRGKLFAVRDPWGFRPLSLGEIVNDDGSKGFVVASESCAFDLIGAKFVRDINPGEMLIFSLESVNSSLGTPCGDFGNLGHFADFSPVSRPKFPKNSTTSTANTRIFDLDSANQAKNAESSADSADSQNLVKNNFVRSTQNSPASWCKKSGEASSSASADFLLEAEKRGSPPKSEKRSFWRVGGAGRGVQPFCEKESSELSGKGGAESNKDYIDSAILSQNGLPRRFCESARNDEFNKLPREQSSLAMTENKIAESNRDSSPTAQNDNFGVRFAESGLDSAFLQEVNSSIADEFLGLCEASNEDRTQGSSRKRAEALPKKSLRDAEFTPNAQFESIQVFPPTPKHCIFEFVYFARPDSVVFNKSVYEIRKNMGIQLAREYKTKADFVIPVPDSGVIAALGYAQESGIPFEFGIVRNHYIGRTFIEPTQKSRELKVKLKLNPISRLLQGKEIIVIDDSVVRGTTSKQIISILRKAGAKKVHLVIASPQTIAPCYYGVDTPDSAHLICANKNLDEVREFIGADSLHFLSLSGLYKSIGIENGEHYCKACFDGEYVV